MHTNTNTNSSILKLVLILHTNFPTLYIAIKKKRPGRIKLTSVISVIAVKNELVTL
jgi:hypothetical protein